MRLIRIVINCTNFRANVCLKFSNVNIMYVVYVYWLQIAPKWESIYLDISSSDNGHIKEKTKLVKELHQTVGRCESCTLIMTGGVSRTPLINHIWS